MSSKEFDLVVESLPAAFLAFGRLLADPKSQNQVVKAEEQIILRLTTEKNLLARAALGFNISTPIDPIALRLLAFLSHQQICVVRYSAAINEAVILVAGGHPERVLEARKVVSKLLISKHLLVHRNSPNHVELGQPLLDFLAGGKTTPILMTEDQLEAKWEAERAAAAKRRVVGVYVNTQPTAKVLAARISEDVVGLDGQVRTFACRVALHQRRAAMIRANQDPGSPNEALLFIGPSGCGKTWLAECAGRVCGIPFGAISSTDLTCEGYIGMSVDDAVKNVIVAANNDVQAARYGICFFDEWDKKRVSGWEHGSRDVAGASVQQSVLRLIEGTEYQCGGRKGTSDWYPTLINTRGMFFVFAGAFVGLDELLGKQENHGLGFGARQAGARSQQFLYDALVDFGMIPEFVNRLSGVMVFPAPTVDDLVRIGERSVIPSYRKLLATCGVDLRITPEGVRLMAECAQETKTYARGIKTILARLIEDAVFEERKGSIQLGVAEVQQALEAAGLGAVGAHSPDGIHPPRELCESKSRPSR